MGQTLTHGIYLPDEGERNCYAGLASNWSLLDGAVGTIAAHTAALAGKAPLVHTHTKADITDFPAYGNAAGTICEGNDSRLSDARTPIAHTHLTADVTDLLNSDHTWTGTNTFTAANFYHTAENPANILKSSTMQEGVIPSGNRTAYTGYWLDKNANILGYDKFTFYSMGIQTYEINLRNKATNGSFSPSGSQIQSGFQLALHSNGNSEFKIYAHTLPNGNGIWNLGDSTHKWKSLNGINPGALSFPNYDDTTYIDISGSIVPPSGQTTINYSGGENQYTPPVDGWLSIRCDGATFLQIYRNSYNCPGTTASRQDASGKLVVTLPVLKNNTYTIKINTSGTTNVFQLYPCLGNV